MEVGLFNEAEVLLMESYQKVCSRNTSKNPQNAQDPETLINRLVCAIATDKQPSVFSSYVSKISQISPHHKFVKDLAAKEAAFDRAAAKFV